MNKIYILTGPVNCGKTTKLMGWVKKRSDAAGILSPTVNGKRHLYSIHSQKYKLCEVENINEEKKNVRIGKFIFLKESFDWAKKEIEKSLKNNPDWMIIDEIGGLELKGEGFNPVMKTISKNMHDSINLLLVIRKRLVLDVLSYYNIGKKDINYVDFL